jgi:hypothetical protein
MGGSVDRDRKNGSHKFSGQHIAKNLILLLKKLLWFLNIKTGKIFPNCPMLIFPNCPYQSVLSYFCPYFSKNHNFSQKPIFLLFTLTFFSYTDYDEKILKIFFFEKEVFYRNF